MGVGIKMLGDMFIRMAFMSGRVGWEVGIMECDALSNCNAFFNCMLLSNFVTR